MSDPTLSDPTLREPGARAQGIEPVREHAGEPGIGRWTRRLLTFLRAMAGLSMLKGLYHWSRVCGIDVSAGDAFAVQSVAWQTATVFFAVIDLVAAVGLWLAAAWGAVLWLTAAASMLAVVLFFPSVFAHGFLIGLTEAILVGVYLWLALKAAQEQPP